MWIYILRRLILLPFTLFCIVLVNFVIINLAPGDPTTFTEISQGGMASRRDDRSVAFPSDERYLQFREFYGLTLPILYNDWPFLSLNYVETTLWQLSNRKESPTDSEEMSSKEYNELRIKFGDQSKFIMPKLLEVISNPHTAAPIRQLAAHFFARGGSRMGYVGGAITPEQRTWNNKVAEDTLTLRKLMWNSETPSEEIEKKVIGLQNWYKANEQFYQLNPNFKEKLKIFVWKTRLREYLNRVIHLDFGTMRNDPSKTVLSEVTKRFKYSLTLSLIPMFITFFLCQIFGFIMAYRQKQWPDYILNVSFLILYAIPIFVVAPFLIEKIALHHHFPFTDTPIPLSGFTSPDRIYEDQNSLQRILDVLKHIALPLVAILYGSLAAEARLSRTAILEVLKQDFVRTAWAKGLPFFTIMFKHVGRNAGITIVTSIASSLGVILGGSLIVETLFDINGFGKFFYDAILNRDYNVIMFSALAGSFLTLLGYLVADIAYMCLDPRITLD